MSAGQALNDMAWQAVIAALTFASVYMLVRYAWYDLGVMLRYQERRYDRVLNHQLLLDIPPRIALAVSGALILLLGLTLGWMVNSFLFFLVGCAIGFFIPNVLIRHMEQKRAAKLETQLVDGITTLSSSVRAGLNLIQAMEVLERNSSAPLKQEIAQMLREYQMGLDFNQCMRNAANRIGSSNYRLLFTAMEMHRIRGGNTGESLDRIAESIREIHRLEGKLDSLTSQGRIQANMMAIMPAVLLVIYYFIDPEAVTMLFTQPLGRVVLLAAAGLIFAGFIWIRRIMTVDI